jgi:hypothetical protein
MIDAAMVKSEASRVRLAACRARRIAAGKCQYCGENDIAADSKTQCGWCRELRRFAKREMRRKRVESGLCRTCARPHKGPNQNCGVCGPLLNMAILESRARKSEREERCEDHPPSGE